MRAHLQMHGFEIEKYLLKMVLYDVQNGWQKKLACVLNNL